MELVVGHCDLAQAKEVTGKDSDFSMRALIGKPDFRKTSVSQRKYVPSRVPLEGAAVSNMP